MIYFSYPPEDGYLLNSEYIYSEDYGRNEYGNNGSQNGVQLQQQNLMPDKFSIDYPVIPNANNKENIAKINNGILDEVNGLFRSQVLIPEVTDFNEILGTYVVTLNEKGILSALFSLYTYVNRAAHGFTAYSSITVNLETGKIYSFSDLFNPKLYYVGFLNELAEQYIKENNIELINQYKGITPDQQYYLTPNSLVLYYQVYEYTPYYYGLFKIEIPYNKISNLITPLSPIARFLNEAWGKINTIYSNVTSILPKN